MERWRRLLQLLSRDSYITNRKLSEELGISRRTVYNDIAGLNDVLRKYGAEVVTRPHYGVILTVTDEERYEAFLRSMQEETAPLGDSSDARARMIIQRMITTAEPVKFDDLCDELFISRSTLKNDLKKVRSILDRYDLTIESSAYRGSRIAGTESNIRKCLTEIGKVQLSDSGRTLKGDMRSIGEIVRKVFQKHRFRMPELACRNLVIHLYIATMRIRLGYAMEAAAGYERFTDDREKRIAADIIGEMETLFGMKFPSSELSYIMLHLESKKGAEEQDNSVVTAEIYGIVTDMLEEIRSMFGYNFQYDFELISMLATHLVPLRVRLLYDMTLENPLIEEIREGALLAYEMANVACSKLVERYGKKVSADEMAYIALHFHLAIERYGENHKKNILIVCGTGRASAELLAYNIRRDYGKYIHILGTYGSSNLTGVDLSDCDYILTTVHIEEKVPVPIIEVNSIRSAESRNKLGAYLRFDSHSELLAFFSRDRFLPHVTERTREDVLRTLCRCAAETGRVSDSFYEHVMQREQLGTTAFGNLLAIPHPYRPEGDESFVVTGLLDEPVDWDGEPVRIVLLLCMKEGGDRSLQLFYKSVGRLLAGRENVQLLLRDRTFETLIAVLDSLREEQE